MTFRSRAVRGCCAALATAATSLALAACTGGSDGPSSSAPAARSGSTAAAPTVSPGGSTAPTSGPTPTVSPSNIDQPASTGPVVRNGKTPTPTVSAPPQPFTSGKRLTYSDGVTLQILSIKQGAVTPDGSKTIAGPKTTFSLRFTNGSGKAITMNQVVVSASYGTRGLAARPVYDDNDDALRDFSGTVAPGASTSAAYAFSIPTSQLSRVTLRVDFDAIHVAASFTGKAQAR